MIVWGYSISTDEYAVRRQFLRLRRNLIDAGTDDNPLAVFLLEKCLSDAVAAFKKHPGGFPFTALELVTEACFFEAERILQSRNISINDLMLLEGVFSSVEDGTLLNRAVEAELANVKTGLLNFKTMHRTFVGFITYYNTYLHLDSASSNTALVALLLTPKYLANFSVEFANAVGGLFLLLFHRKSAREYDQKIKNAIEVITQFRETLSLPYPDRVHTCRNLYPNKGNDEGSTEAYQLAEHDAWRITRSRLILQAIKITRYRVENGLLPKSLSDIEQHIDPYSGHPFRYDKAPGGVRLSSVGPGPIFEEVEDHSFYEVYFGDRPKYLTCALTPGQDKVHDSDSFGLIPALLRKWNSEKKGAPGDKLSLLKP